MVPKSADPVSPTPTRGVFTWPRVYQSGIPLSYETEGLEVE